MPPSKKRERMKAKRCVQPMSLQIKVAGQYVDVTEVKASDFDDVQPNCPDGRYR